MPITLTPAHEDLRGTCVKDVSIAASHFTAETGGTGAQQEKPSLLGKKGLIVAIWDEMSDQRALAVLYDFKYSSFKGFEIFIPCVDTECK